jgi:hypothetical protein
MAADVTGLSCIFVIPAEAGIHGLICISNAWIPIYTGMTGSRSFDED